MTLVRNAPAKPARGSGLIARHKAKAETKAYEEAQKRDVRARDRRCRWPNCENCKQFKPRLEVAHLDAKGQGGDHGVRSAASMMILLDFLTHQGELGLERHERKIEPLTSRGTAGPCAFYVKFWSETKKGEWIWRCVGREVAIGILERP